MLMVSKKDQILIEWIKWDISVTLHKKIHNFKPHIVNINDNDCLYNWKQMKKLGLINKNDEDTPLYEEIENKYRSLIYI